MTSDPKPLMTVKQVARLLGVGKSTIWRWCKQGKFPRPIKLSQRITRWRAEDVAALTMRSEEVNFAQ